MPRFDDFVMTVEEEAAEAVPADPDDADDTLRVSFAQPGAPSRAVGLPEPHGARRRAAVTFESLKLSRPLLKAVENAGFEEATRIQELAIPVILDGGDVCGTAVTGSGKTAAFMLPVLQRLLIRTRRSASTAALVLLPTRELAMQCQAMTARLARYTSVQTSLVVGGLSLKVQEAELRSRPDLVIGTPGRLIDLVRNSPAVTLESIEVLVLDEADRLLELGFRAEIDEILKMTPRGRQTLLFTATMSPAVEQLIAASLNRPTSVRVNEEMGVASTLLQEFVRVHGESAAAEPSAGARRMGQSEREATLLSLLSRTFLSGVLIFTRSRSQAHKLATLMRACDLKVRLTHSCPPPSARPADARLDTRISRPRPRPCRAQAGELHGELTQLQRMEQLERFRAGSTHYLVATDLASRGLDIEGVQTVVNFHMPAGLRSYVHRVGRTARAGRCGRAISLVSGADKAVLEEIVKRAPHAAKTRVVPDASVEEWSARVLALQPALRETYAREKEDKELRVAEMEVRAQGCALGCRTHGQPYARQRRRPSATASRARALTTTARPRPLRCRRTRPPTCSRTARRFARARGARGFSRSRARPSSRPGRSATSRPPRCTPRCRPRARPRSSRRRRSRASRSARSHASRSASARPRAS